MKALKYVGLFDERMRQYCSDNDYCIRMHQMGYRVVLVVASEIKHYIGSSSKDLTANKDQEVLTNKLSCSVISQLLDDYPLDSIKGIKGRLTFDITCKNL